MDGLDTLRAQTLAEIAAAADEAALEDARLAALGKKGAVSLRMRARSPPRSPPARPRSPMPRWPKGWPRNGST